MSESQRLPVRRRLLGPMSALESVAEQGVAYGGVVEHLPMGVPGAVVQDESPVELPVVLVGQLHGGDEPPEVAGVSVDALVEGLAAGQLALLGVGGPDGDGEGERQVAADALVAAEVLGQATEAQAEVQIPCGEERGATRRSASVSRNAAMRATN
jgi:hypothetical protein